MKEASDIWTQMLQGNKLSLELLYKNYVQVLYDYGFRICANEQVTQDCIQELFVDIWIKRENLKPTQHVKAYLMLSLRRRIYRTLEKEKRIYSDGENTSSFVLDVDPETKYIQKEVDYQKSKKLKEAISQLSASQKEIIYLKFEQNMSNQEIADFLGIKNQSVRNTMHRAITRLKELLIILLLLSTIDSFVYLLFEGGNYS